MPSDLFVSARETVGTKWKRPLKVMNDSYPEFLKSISGLVASLNDMHQLAVHQLTPLVQDILRSRSRDIRRIEQTLDGLLDHCGYEPALRLYKQLCRYYFQLDPAATVSYINTYREMWDAETEEETVMSGDVKPGYKQTEVGVIPEDWVLKYVSAIATTVASGKSHVNSEFGNYPVYGSTGIIGRCTHYDYSGKAILIARVGANAGKLSVVDGEYGVTDNTVIVRVDGSSNLDYFWRQLEAKRLNSLVFGSGQPLITGTQIKRLVIPFPPTKAEQEAIAEALSDADALIESLTQLIAKKRQIKQGAMQELLTGKRRLHGFANATSGYKQTEVGVIPEDWELDQVENIAHITTGGKNTQDRVDDGQYPFFVRSQTVERINSYSFDGEAVLTAGDGVGTGKVFHYINGKFDTHQRVYRITDFSERVNGYFFYLYFSSRFYSRIMQMTAKSSVDSVRREMIAKMLIPLPPTKGEQEAIAEVLREMDAEIAALENKLAKARAIKQGMMHNLLTGRIRLVGGANQDNHRNQSP